MRNLNEAVRQQCEEARKLMEENATKEAERYLRALVATAIFLTRIATKLHATGGEEAVDLSCSQAKRIVELTR